ncbi:hypothetical protein ACFQ2B_30550 [Streptomyces stramineus]
MLRHPVLRVIAAATGVANFFSAMLLSVQTVFLVRVLDLPPGVLGLMLSASAVGGLAGALCAGPIARAVGQARTIWLAPSPPARSPSCGPWPDADPRPSGSPSPPPPSSSAPSSTTSPR